MRRRACRGWRGWCRPAGFALLLTVVAGGLDAHAQAPPALSGSRLRPMDAKSAALLQAGNARSATFKELTDALEQSDVVVWVRVGQMTNRGETHFIASTASSRIVRVSLRLQGLENGLLSTLAHELQHALEIARAPEVRDRTSLVLYYQRVGEASRSSAGALLETPAAQRIEARVLNELLDRTSQRQ